LTDLLLLLVVLVALLQGSLLQVAVMVAVLLLLSLLLVLAVGMVLKLLGLAAQHVGRCWCFLLDLLLLLLLNWVLLLPQRSAALQSPRDATA
jgi:hypothetical protein